MIPDVTPNGVFYLPPTGWLTSFYNLPKMKEATKQELEEKYHFSQLKDTTDNFRREIQTINKELNELKQNVNNDDNLTIRDLKQSQKVDSIISRMNNDFAQKTFDATVQKTNIELQALKLASLQESRESKKLASTLQGKIDKLMNNKTFEFGYVFCPLSKVYKTLKSSNNKDATNLADYLNTKYPNDTLSITINAFQ
jgi:uncharacterized protein YeeX (DUF496 family)